MASSKSAISLVSRRLMLLAAACLVLAYPAARLGVFEWPRAYDPLALPDLTQKPRFLTPWQMRTVDYHAPNCVLALQRAGLPSILRPAKNSGTSCEVLDAVTVRAFSQAKIRPEDMRCAIAARLYMWERHHLQPAAKRILGEEITDILHFGSFSCRQIRGGFSMSEHAKANAFDISGFKTKSGKIISLKRDWGKSTPEAALLREARNGLCNWFNATLSPDYNADHADHFHVDMGWWQTCR
jgi:hypothetical protein